MIPPISCRTTHINNTAAASILFASLNITQSSLGSIGHWVIKKLFKKLFLALCKVKINIFAGFSRVDAVVMGS